jgi:hypothetical protein
MATNTSRINFTKFYMFDTMKETTTKEKTWQL